MIVAGNITGDGEKGQVAVICRLNSTLFDEVAKYILSVPSARVGFTGVAEMKVRTLYKYSRS